MLIGTSFGALFCYDVCEHRNGYVVMMRDEDDDSCSAETTLFRSLPTALRFAEWVAAYDRARAAEDIGDDDICRLAQSRLVHEWSRYTEVSRLLLDDGEKICLVDPDDLSGDFDGTPRTFH